LYSDHGTWAKRFGWSSPPPPTPPPFRGRGERAWFVVCVLVGGCICLSAGAAETWTRHAIDDTLRGADGVKLADFDGDGRLEIVTGWEEGGQTRVYLHPGRERVRQRWPNVTVGRTPSVEDAVPVDFNHDGSMDIVSLCEGDARSLFVHWGSHQGDPQAIVQPARWRQAAHPPELPRIQWMFAAEAPGQAAGEVVLIAGGKGNGAVVGRLTARREVAADGRELLSVTWQALSPAGWIMSIVPLDVDGDGDVDVLLSDRRGSLRGVRWLENPLPDGDDGGPWKSRFIGGRDRKVMFLTVSDLDGDGLQDVLAATKPADLLWLRRVDASGTNWEAQELRFPPDSGTAKAVAVGDLDQDGVDDLVISCEQASGQKSGVWWFQRKNAKSLAEGDWHNISGPEGTKYDLVELIDLDADGDLDVLTCEESYQGRGLGVVWYENPHH
jgi:hypothetical protein